MAMKTQKVFFSLRVFERTQNALDAGRKAVAEVNLPTSKIKRIGCADYFDESCSWKTCWEQTHEA
jgi:hypothetical protein